MVDGILVAENIEGSLHDAVWSVNRRSLGGFVLTMHYLQEHFTTIVVYKIPAVHCVAGEWDEVLPEFKAALARLQENATDDAD